MQALPRKRLRRGMWQQSGAAGDAISNPEISSKNPPICDRQIGPISLRSEGLLIEAHNPYEPMLCEELGDELYLARTRNTRGFQWAVAGAELGLVPKCFVS